MSVPAVLEVCKGWVPPAQQLCSQALELRCSASPAGAAPQEEGPEGGSRDPVPGHCSKLRADPREHLSTDGLETPPVAAQEAETDPRHSC